MGIITFVLKGKTPQTWAIGQNNIMALRPETGYEKFINYYKGRDSIFMEDYQDKKEIKPTQAPLFEFNISKNRTELNVKDTDKNLITFLKSHPEYGKNFEISSAEIEADKQIEGYGKIEAALEAIKGASDSVKAAAVAVLGFDYFSKTDKECEAALKEKAFKNPQSVISIIKSPNFASREIAALAFCAGIIKHSPTATEVLWADGGLILTVATGENGLDKLTEKLNDGSQTGQSLLQEIGLKVNKKAAEVKAAKTSDEDRIATLERQLAEANAQIAKKEATTAPDLELDEATAKYKEIKGTDVPVKYKNNAEWINEALRKENA